MKQVIFPIIAISFLVACGCNKSSQGDGGGTTPPPPPAPGTSDVTTYLTLPSQFVYFKKQTTAVNFKEGNPEYQAITVDTAARFQSIDGFGYTLTGGSAQLIHGMGAAKEDELLKELFTVSDAAIGVSYIRVSIGASDLDASVFSYNDIGVNDTDFELNNFSIERDRANLIPVLKKIVALDPDIKILGSPWSAPQWMKTNKEFKGGKLRPDCYEVYAKYLVKYIQAMKAEGIVIDAITPQNEPLHGGNNPSMVMEAAEQADFIKNHLGPAFEAANLETKIIIYDHNADRPDYPLAILNDPAAAKYVDGSAFHLYGGAINALSQLHDAHPDKHIYFTEQWVGGPGNFPEDLKWHVENLIIGATRNWSRNVLEWNLASDPNYDPHTPGGCSNCLGALTISSTVTRNVAYYIIAHASKYVRPGSVRIGSTQMPTLLTVAFKNPDGQKVLIVLNKDTNSQTFSIKQGTKHAAATLGAGGVATYVW